MKIVLHNVGTEEASGLLSESTRKETAQFYTMRKGIYGVETLYIACILLLYGLRFGYLHLIFPQTQKERKMVTVSLFSTGGFSIITGRQNIKGTRR
jgi:hypothetical protein